MRRRHRSYSDEGSGLLGRLFKLFLVLAVLVGAGGATWLVLTPLDAPMHEVTRPLPSDRLSAH